MRLFSDKKKKKDKDRHKSKNKSKSRERSREKKKRKEKSKERRSREKISRRDDYRSNNSDGKEVGAGRISKSPEKEEKVKVKERSPSPDRNRRSHAEEDRAKKFAMRQVRARLLKLNGLYGVNSDDSDDDVRAAPAPTAEQ